VGLAGFATYIVSMLEFTDGQVMIREKVNRGSSIGNIEGHLVLSYWRRRGWLLIGELVVHRDKGDVMLFVYVRHSSL
jgi:hypothetical protein